MRFAVCKTEAADAFEVQLGVSSHVTAARLNAGSIEKSLSKTLRSLHCVDLGSR